MRYTCLFYLCVASALALNLTKTYDRHAVLSANANLSWSLSTCTKSISFALEVADLSLLNLGEYGAWLAIGIGEQSTGGMLGSDIYTAKFDADVFDRCTVKNRFVPFSASPLTKDPMPFPEEDRCQNDESWNLVACKRDVDKGRAILEVSRPLKASTPQDRPVLPGEQPVLHAYGLNLSYHGKYRGSKRIVLFNSSFEYPKVSVPPTPLPLDALESHTITASNYSLPMLESTNACRTKYIPIPEGEQRYVVAVDPIVDSTSYRNVGAVSVYSCKDGIDMRGLMDAMDKCTPPEIDCSLIFIDASMEKERLVLPKNVGFLLEKPSNILLVNIQYINPDSSTDILDNSGAKVYLSKSRSIEAGMLTLGDSALSLSGQILEPVHNVLSTCPSNCTSKWESTEISVFNSFPLMHSTGQEMHTNRYDSSGTFIEAIQSVQFWSQGKMRRREFTVPKIIQKGDILSTTCTYNTTKKPRTKFGLGSEDEICKEHLMYYPAQRRKTGDGSEFSCGMRYVASTPGKLTYTLCGSKPQGVLLIKNPSFEDRVGSSLAFGKNGTCKPLAGRSASPLCFPGKALLKTRTRGVVTMEDLKVGDEVLIGRKPEQFSRVFMFTHRKKNILEKFTSLEAESGHNIQLTGGHMLYVNGYLARAENVKLGDTLLDAEGMSREVVSITSTLERGLYNPQTEHGDVIVNGIVCSTYTDAVEPNTAHALLAPLRMLKYRPRNFPSLF